MTAEFFVDTNVLVYAASGAAADQARRDAALELLDRSDLARSAQVLAEFYAVATSKTKLNLTHDEAVVPVVLDWRALLMVIATLFPVSVATPSNDKRVAEVIVLTVKLKVLVAAVCSRRASSV